VQMHNGQQREPSEPLDAANQDQVQALGENARKAAPNAASHGDAPIGTPQDKRHRPNKVASIGVLEPEAGSYDGIFTPSTIKR